MSTGHTITIEAPDGSAPAYLSGNEGAPGVLFYVDAIGLRPQIEEMADRIASWGYTVLAPHVFYRDGTPQELAPQRDLRDASARKSFFASGVMERVNGLTAPIAAADAETWLSALGEHAGDGPVATTGYCMGARLAVRLSGQFPDRVAAVGGFHGGGLVTEAEDSPHLAISRARATYAFGHADKDGSMPPAAIAALGAALDDAGRPHTNEVYRGAPHGYTMADTSTYDADAAARHFEALQGLLDSTLSAG